MPTLAGEDDPRHLLALIRKLEARVAELERLLAERKP